MAGSLALIASEPLEIPLSAVKHQWQVSFSRLIVYPSLSSTHSSLVPLPNKRRSQPTPGTWISAPSPTACLQLLYSHSSSDAILSVSLDYVILEEHYVSKLHFTWPQVSCLSGYPPRGSKAIQKSTFRFTSIAEAEKFMNTLKEIARDSTEFAPLNSDFQSEISLQSMSPSPGRACEEESTVVSPITSNSSKLPLTEEESRTENIAPSQQYDDIFSALSTNFPSFLSNSNEVMLTNEVEEVSQTEATAPDRNHEGTSTALPRSCASFLTNCYSEVKQDTAQTSSAQDVDLRSQIARYMEDSAFQELLIKAEQVISVVGSI